jgi:hypothetical protein
MMFMYTFCWEVQKCNHICWISTQRR